MAQFAELVMTARTDSLRTAKSDLNSLKQAGADTEAGIKRAMKGVEDSVSRVPKAANDAARSFEVLRRSLDPAYASSQQYAQVQKEIAASVQAGVTTQRVANTMLEQAASKYMGVATGAERAAAAQAQAERSAREQAQAVEQATQSYASLRASIDPVFAASKRYEAAQEQLNVAVRAGVVSQQEANRVLAMAEKQYLGLGASAAAAGAKISRGFSNSLRQVGLQLNQVAQVGGMTGNWASALAIQLPDLALSFGTVGVFAGVAAGALIPFITSLLSGRDNAKELEESIEGLTAAADRYISLTTEAKRATADLVAEFGDLAEEARRSMEFLAGVQLQQALETLRTTIGAFDSQGLDRFVQVIRDGPAELEVLNDTYNKALEGIREQFGLTGEQALKFADSLHQIATAETPREIVSEVDRLNQYLLEAFGSAQNIPPEIREMVQRLLEAQTAAARMATVMDGATSATNAAAGAASGLAGQLSVAAQYAAQLAANLAQAPAGIAAFQNKAAQLTAQIAALDAGLGQVKAGAAGLRVELEQKYGLADAANEAEKAYISGLINRQVKEYENVENLNKAYTDKVSALNKVAKAAGGAGSAAKKALKDAATEAEAYEKALKDAAMTAEELGTAKADIMIRGIDGVSNAFGDFIGRGLTDFKGFVKDILSSFTGMISDMISMAARNEILLSLGFGGGGTLGGTAQRVGSAVQQAGGGGGLGGLIGSIGGAASSFISGASGLITSLTGAGGGLAAAGTYLSSVLSGATASIGGFAAAAGALALPIAGVAALFSFFKTKTKELGRGIRVTADLTSDAVQTYELLEKKKFWGLSKKTVKDYEDATADLADPMSQAIADIRASSMLLGETLGLTSEYFSSFAVDFEFSTKDLSEDQIAEEIQKALTTISDAMAYAALGSFDVVHGIIREGESATDTLINLSAALATVNGSFRELGFALFDISVLGAKAARDFADMFGGIEAFANSMSFYVDAFYSDSEKLGIITQRVNDALAGLDPRNIATALDSREMFKALTDWAGSNAANDPAQADLFTKLINAAPLIDQMFQLQDAIDTAATSAGGAGTSIGGLNTALREREGLERRLLTLQGDTVALREMERAALDPSNRALLDQIHILEDKAEADQLAARIATTRADLERELLQIQGDTSALRQLELDVLDESLRPLQEQIFALRDQAEAAAEAAQAERDLADTQEAIADERRGLERDLLESQGDTAALRALELASLDPSNRALQERIWAINAETEAAAEAAAIQEAILSERTSLEDRLLQAQGDVDAIRARELASLDASNRAILEQIFALEDATAARDAEQQAIEAAEAEAQRIAEERLGLERQLIEAQGDTAALRQLELASLDPSNRALKERIWAIEDENEALAAQAAIVDERLGLERRMLELNGDTAAIRQLELDAIDPANRALLKSVFARQDEIAAIEEANRIATETADERYSLESRLMELQGDIAGLRARELEALFPANRALQEQIWALEDAAEAADNFTIVLDDMRTKMRDALSLVESLIGTEIDAIQSAAQARIDALQSEIDMARDMADVARDTLQGAFDVVRASIDADRTMAVAGYTAAIERLDNRMEAATANVDRLRGVFDLLDGALEGRVLGGVRREQGRYMEAQGYIRGLTGLPTDTAALQGAIQALSGDGERFYSNSTDFEFDFLRTNAALSKLRGQAGNQLSDAERQVAAIETSRAAREAQHEREMSRLDDQLAVAQGIYDEAIGNTINLVDVGTGIDGLRNAADQYTSLTDQLLAIETTAGAEIEAISDAADMQIGLLEDQLSTARKSVEIAEGTYQSIETIQAAIDHLNQTITAFSEANDQVGSKFASDTTEAIISAPVEVNDLRNENSKENARLLEQNRLLTEEVRELRDDMNQLLKAISSNTKTTANLQQKFDVEGIKERTT